MSTTQVTGHPKHRTRTLLVGLSTLALAATGLAAAAMPAQAAKVGDTSAVLQWELNGASGGKSHASGCSYFTAGEATEALFDGFHPPVDFQEGKDAYRNKVGNVEIVHVKNGASAKRVAKYEDRCAPANSKGKLAQAVRWSKGNIQKYSVATNSVTIKWTGSWSVNFYNGGTPFTFTDPVLTVVNGKGTLKANMSGKSSDRADIMGSGEGEVTDVSSDNVTVATLEKVKLTKEGFVAMPKYLGETAPKIKGVPQIKKDNKDPDVYKWRGSFPQPFVKFQDKMGLAPFWYSRTVGSKDNEPKLPKPIIVSLNGSPSAASRLATKATASKPKKSTYGKKASVKVSVKYSKIGGVVDGGTVRIYNGSKSLGTATVKNGKATVKLSQTLTPKTYKLRAKYLGSATATASAKSNQVSLKVNKAATTAKLSLKQKTRKSGQNLTGTARVSINGSKTKVTGGSVKVYSGKKVVKTFKVTKKNKGKVKISLKVSGSSFKKGTRSLTVKYTPNKTMKKLVKSSKKSKAVKLTVR